MGSVVGDYGGVGGVEEEESRVKFWKILDVVKEFKLDIE